MSAGSDNSNMGYGGKDPYGQNVNPAFVNKWSSNNPANFSSNEIYRGTGGLFGAVNNVNAASGVVPGIGLFNGFGLFKGGAHKKLKSKIKNITKRYKRKMHKNKRSAKKHVRSMKSRIRAKYGGRRNKYTRASRRQSHHRRHRTLRGGYSQYYNNFPNTPSYSVGGVLSASNSALANPPPINELPNCVNCVDNYSRFLNAGFASKGH
jgi:hypothetical protein